MGPNQFDDGTQPTGTMVPPCEVDLVALEVGQWKNDPLN
jgi:hypothetical protein